MRMQKKQCSELGVCSEYAPPNRQGNASVSNQSGNAVKNDVLHACDEALESIFRKNEITFHVCFTNHIWNLRNVKCESHFPFPISQIMKSKMRDMKQKMYIM